MDRTAIKNHVQIINLFVDIVIIDLNFLNILFLGIILFFIL